MIVTGYQYVKLYFNNLKKHLQPLMSIYKNYYSYLRSQILLYEPFHYENHMFYKLMHIDFEVHHQELYQLNDQILYDSLRVLALEELTLSKMVLI